MCTAPDTFYQYPAGPVFGAGADGAASAVFHNTGGCYLHCDAQSTLTYHTLLCYLQFVSMLSAISPPPLWLNKPKLLVS